MDAGVVGALGVAGGIITAGLTQLGLRSDRRRQADIERRRQDAEDRAAEVDGLKGLLAEYRTETERLRGEVTASYAREGSLRRDLDVALRRIDQLERRLGERAY